MKTYAWVMPTSDGKATWVCDYDVPAMEAREKGYLVHDLVLREDAERAIAEAVAAERMRCRAAVAGVGAGMFNCDANGSPIDEYIAKWRAVEVISELND
jgi:hypothetical protein